MRIILCFSSFLLASRATRSLRWRWCLGYVVIAPLKAAPGGQEPQGQTPQAIIAKMNVQSYLKSHQKKKKKKSKVAQNGNPVNHQ